MDGVQTLDAFGRQRVSQATTLFDWQAQYDEGPLIWAHKTSGTASAAHRANESSVRLTVGTAKDDEIVRQTREYIRYQPGKSQLIFMTFVMGAPKVGCRREIGYGDASNGIFLREENGALSMVLRSKTTGSVVENVVPQSQWGDTEPWPSTNSLSSMSSAALDTTKAQIFVIDMEWLGVGRVRTGFVLNGQIHLAHAFDHANIVNAVYMTTANLPLHYRIVNTAATSGSSTLDAICSTVMSEGGFERARGGSFSVSNGSTRVSVTTRRPILSIRPKATFNSIVNRAEITLNEMSATVADNPALIEIVYNGTLTNASFATAGASSVVDFDTAATAISGGITVASEYIGAASQGSVRVPGTGSLGLLSRLPLTLDIDGANPTPITVVATSLNSTALVSAALNWQEMR